MSTLNESFNGSEGEKGNVTDQHEVLFDEFDPNNLIDYDGCDGYEEHLDNDSDDEV